jgi:hypothetical protein
VFVFALLTWMTFAITGAAAEAHDVGTAQQGTCKAKSCFIFHIACRVVKTVFDFLFRSFSQSGAAASLVGMDCEGVDEASCKKAKFSDEGNVSFHVATEHSARHFLNPLLQLAETLLWPLYIRL